MSNCNAENLAQHAYPVSVITWYTRVTSSFSFNAQGEHSDRYWYMAGGAKKDRKKETERMQLKESIRIQKILGWTVGLQSCQGAKGGGVDHLWRQGIPLPRSLFWARSWNGSLPCITCYLIKGLCVGVPWSLRLLSEEWASHMGQAIVNSVQHGELCGLTAALQCTPVQPLQHEVYTCCLVVPVQSKPACFVFHGFQLVDPVQAAWETCRLGLWWLSLQF